MTKERPILFSTPMVEAILDGRKTQTRRTRGLEEINKNPGDWNRVGDPIRKICRFWDPSKEKDPNPIDIHYGFCFNGNRNHDLYIPCPYGKPGDRLWVRETWLKLVEEHIMDAPIGMAPYIYRANCDADSEDARKDYIRAGYPYQWKPSIHMPEAVARIWLEVTDIMVERLQDISKEDAIAEGVDTYFNSIVKQDCYRDYLFKGEDWATPEGQYYYPTWSFRSLWESINGAESWDLNPWLWVVKFKVLTTTGKEAIQ